MLPNRDITLKPFPLAAKQLAGRVFPWSSRAQQRMVVTSLLMHKPILLCTSGWVLTLVGAAEEGQDSGRSF